MRREQLTLLRMLMKQFDIWKKQHGFLAAVFLVLFFRHSSVIVRTLCLLITSIAVYLLKPELAKTVLDLLKLIFK